MTEESKVTQKIRVGVIFGGRSGEHEVSLQSARSVMGALDEAKYEVVPVGITKDGRWVTGDVVAALAEGLDTARPATLLPDPQASALMQVEMEAAKPAALSEVAQLDVIFPVLHGPYGEDGTVQGLLELAGLPYVGAGVVGSAVGMDKAIFKYVMAANGLPLLPWLLFTRGDWRERPSHTLDEIEAKLHYPVFTKPANLGSSVGIRKCHDRAELEQGMAEAADYDRRIVVEQGIDARELEISVLGNDDPIASVVGEVRPRREFYDYTAKYLLEPDSDEYSELLIPAEVPADTAEALRTLAVQAYKAIDCAGLGRVDLLLDKDSGEIYVNEINTIPGFTRISMYPKLWEATGMSYPELLDRLISLAIERADEKGKTRTRREE
ncbi:MAG: D-alanine--D-alanine ligase [Ardenticatenaceae bacterium]|nr:D-alanine--D-alanine ligase [Ardenticatenaceae bacterium]MCB8990505.1 D-alanine--D-alanine ligase [Ardenticatenaceae bacterium]